MTRVAVCQRDAPSARLAAERCAGTFEKASSAIVKMIGMTAKPIAKPMMIELRGSYLTCQFWKSQLLKSPPKAVCSNHGPIRYASHAPTITTATSSAISRSLPKRVRTERGRAWKPRAAATTASGTTGARSRVPTVVFSTRGASQRPARKPITTEGRAAMISTMGLTNRRTAGAAKMAA